MGRTLQTLRSSPPVVLCFYPLRENAFIQRVMQVLDEDREFFLTAESWQISSFYVEHPTCFSIETHQRFISNIRSCLRQWVAEGKTLFIHRQLYRDGIPRIMQDVYTTCTAYLTKNKANETMILRIIEERAAQLIEEQDLVEELHHSNSLSCVLDHLARVQALLIYQIIRLFDGNIRQSGEAERQIPRLFPLGCTDVGIRKA